MPQGVQDVAPVPVKVSVTLPALQDLQAVFESDEYLPWSQGVQDVAPVPVKVSVTLPAPQVSQDVPVNPSDA